MGYTLGVDVGTTYTAVGICRDGRAEIAPLGARGWTVPSVVYLGADQTVLVGEPAVRRSASDPLRVVREFKRRIGDPVPLMVGGAPVSADTLTSIVLRAVVQQVVALESGPPDHAVVTHPANWGPYKIDCLWQAIRMANLDQLCHVSLMSEPEAAATYYASTERLESTAVIAVYDLGGGTFDAAVLRRANTGWEFLTPAEGIERLGGIDFDEAVLAHVNSATNGRLQALDPTDTAAMAALLRLRSDCVDAKEALSSDIDATIRVAFPDYQAEVRITRSEFEAMIEPSVRVSVDALRRVLRSAGVEPDQLRAVLLVGGSSRIPIISQIIGQSLHVPVAVDAHPKHSVALGAAHAAYQRNEPGVVTGREHTNPPQATTMPPPPNETTAPMAAFPLPPGAGGSAEPDMPRHRAASSTVRRRWLWIAAAAAVVVVGGGTVLALTRGGGVETASSTPPSESSVASIASASAESTGQSGPVELQVSSTVPWTGTGVDCRPGRMLAIEADGSVQPSDDDASNAAGPDGLSEPLFRQFNVPGLSPDANHSALIGSIGERSPFFVVGSSLVYTCTGSGELYLGVNDAGLENNSGDFSATVTVFG